LSQYRSIFRPDLFADRVIVVTGGGSGIGRCTAHELAALGATVVLTGRKASKLETVAQELVEDGIPKNRIGMASFDIREEEAVKGAVEKILADFGKVDGLVNNAGGQFAAPAVMISAKGFDSVVRTNLLGGFLVARELMTQHWTRTPGGAVVNMLADMWRGMPGMAHSGAARMGMLNLTKTLAVEWAPQGVRVNAVAPGWVASSGMDTYPEHVQAMIPHLKASVPLKRMASEAEISAAIVFLLSPASAFTTGACLNIDGAASMAPLHWPMPDHDNSEMFDGFHRAVLPKALQEG
jgi:citronellol/citronellal dehydrogenase